MSIKIVTDSTSYIPKEFIEKYDIRVVSLSVITNGESERELDINSKEFYEKIDKSDKLPTSSQPAMDEFEEVFLNPASEGNNIIGIFLSSKLSGTYSTSHLIKNIVTEKYPNAKIELIDGETTAMSMGFLVVEAAKLAMEGKLSLEEIKNHIIEMKKRVDIVFIPGSLKNLQKGGRLGKIASLIGGILKITPLLHVKDGQVDLFDKIRTHKKAVDKMFEKVKLANSEKTVKAIVVYHILNEAEGIEIKERVKSEFGIDAQIMDIGAVIGLHVGPRSVGLAFYTEK
ncbi:DegV family protein [uncultured Clostridium sp.]|uniref:DegV family protein n=1 Tax=uncultured Clostridium sp. TaxID=59620 RepID=UPI0026106621|nr:DegV family protein [uncultured Clostridium sp.]